MRSFFYTLLALTLAQTAIAQEQKHWIYGGLDLGLGTQKNSDNEDDTNNGRYYGGKILYQYRLPELQLEAGLGWLDYKVSNDIKTGQYSAVRLKTQAPYLHTAIYYRATSQFSFGLTANYILDNGILISATDEAKLLAGVGMYYNIPNEKFDVRVGLNAQRTVEFSDRNATLFGLSVQVGMPLDKKEAKPVRRNQVVKSVGHVMTKTDVTLVTLDETLINFETDSFSLDMQSKALIADLGAFLASNQDIWQEVMIEGHTDLRGSDYYNNVLSVRRANSVYQELLKVSLSSKKLNFEGSGKQKPLDPSINLEAFAKNRRVDLKFINVSNKAHFNAFITKLKTKYQRN